MLLFGGITMGLYRQHGERELWIGATLLVGTVLALVITTLQRKRAAAADRPTEYLGNFYRKLEQDSSNWISRAVRQASSSCQPFLSPGRVRFDTNASYHVSLIGNLSWDISLYGNWDNRPPQGFSGSDYGTSSGLSWTFGLK